MTVDNRRGEDAGEGPSDAAESERHAGGNGTGESERGEPSDVATDAVPEAVRDSVDDDVVAEVEAEVPEWDDEFFDRVADRLMFNYDLTKDERVHGEAWDLFGKMRIENQKQFLHRSINFANHHVEEYLFARRESTVTTATLERLVDLAHDLADEWITPDEEHQGTEFTFVLVTGGIAADVRRTVEAFTERQLLKFGYYGHYEVNFVVVDLDAEDAVASPHTDIDRAFALWRDPGAERTSAGLLARLARALRR